MVNVSRVGNSITGNVGQEHFGIKYTEAKFDELVKLAAVANAAETREELNAAYEVFKAAAVEDFSETIATACPYIHINTSTGKFYLKQGDKLSVHAMPKSFVERILESVEKKIDVLPLIHFWTRLLRNPNFSPKKAKLICGYIANTYVDNDLVAKLVKEQGVSYETAAERATGRQTPITLEGLLCTYKVSTEILHKYEMKDVDGVQTKVRSPRYTSTTVVVDDITGETKTDKGLPEFVEERVFEPAVMGQNYDAFYCGSVLGHIIKVGQTHSLPNWDQVNCTDGISCVKGLHVGNLDYIRGYQSAGKETHYTFVDPMYIGAVTNDGSGALRVKEYFTYDSFAGVTKSIYHSSTYAKKTDADWEVFRAEAIEQANKVKAEEEAQVQALTEQE